MSSNENHMQPNENHLAPSRFDPTPENVALAIEHARRSTPDLKWGGVEHKPGEVEELLSKGAGKVWLAWTGPKDAALYAAVTGNGPTSEANALFFAHARDVVIALGEEVQRLRELEELVRDQLVPIVEMDDEANDPSKDLFVTMYRVKDLLDAAPRPTSSTEVK